MRVKPDVDGKEGIFVDFQRGIHDERVAADLLSYLFDLGTSRRKNFPRLKYLIHRKMSVSAGHQASGAAKNRCNRIRLPPMILRGSMHIYAPRS